MPNGSIRWPCPQDMRSAVLAPDSYWALAGSQTALFAPNITTQAYRQGEIGDIGGVEHLHVAERADVHRHCGAG